jgi:hypothetical protein
MSCNECGGINGWLIVDKLLWENTRKELEKCDVCGYYSFCTRSNSDIRYIAYGVDSKPMPYICHNHQVIKVRVVNFL